MFSFVESVMEVNIMAKSEWTAGIAVPLLDVDLPDPHYVNWRCVPAGA